MLPGLSIPTVGAFKIIETNASDIGYGDILKQRVSPESSVLGSKCLEQLANHEHKLV